MFCNNSNFLCKILFPPPFQPPTPLNMHHWPVTFFDCFFWSNEMPQKLVSHHHLSCFVNVHPRARLLISLRFDSASVTSKLSSQRRKKMRLFLAVFALVLAIFLVAGDIVEKNGICVDEIKALEVCLNAAGQGQGWCQIGKSVIFHRAWKWTLCSDTDILP